MFGFFMDLRSAFNRIDRRILWEAMKRRGIRRGLIKRTKEFYESTTNVVKVNGVQSGGFWTEKGVRQGCPLSLVFTLLTADVEDEMKKGQIDGVQIGKKRFWTLAYADDLVMLAKSEESMRELMKRMKRYIRKKKLLLNTEKSKMICFRRRGGRRKKIEWKWEDQKIEEVKELKYLGFIVKYNGSKEE